MCKATWENWKRSCDVGMRGPVGIGGTWMETEGFVSPMLGDRMCSREVTVYPGGVRPLIYALWTWLRPGSRPSNLQMGPTGRWREGRKTTTPEVTRGHSPRLFLSPLSASISLLFNQTFSPSMYPPVPLSWTLVHPTTLRIIPVFCH